MVSQRAWVGWDGEVGVKKVVGEGRRRSAVLWMRLRAIFVKAVVVPAGPVARRERTMARRLEEIGGG